MPGSRPHRTSLVASALVVIGLSTGGILAARAASGVAGPAAGPRLTANTPAPCNRPQPRGFARCLAVVRTAASHQIRAQTAGPPSTALGPADIQSAYRLSATGGGQTVAIIDAYGDSHAEADLAVFRAHYGLPSCATANGCFLRVNQHGVAGGYPPDDPGWALETSLDLDAVSAACPKCNILLVEASSAGFTDLGQAVNEAVALGARFVSNSYGITEIAAERSFDHYYDHPGVAVTASAGDNGYGTSWPSASPYVTAVGGTTLTKDSSSPRGWTEAVWGSASGGEGTGSGCSPYEPKPAGQGGVNTGCARRAVADVSADADPATGLAVYDTLGENGWLQVGGTSLSAPLVSSVYALGGTPVAGTYPASYPYHDPHLSRDVFDITQGANADCGTLLCQAGKGWDGPTGLGAPDGVLAFSSGPHGQITGRVTSQVTGRPLSGAAISASPGDYVSRTGTNGDYTLSVAAGRYHVTAAAFGYTTGARSGVQVTAGRTATASFALATEPSGRLSGTVTDGSGHGWALHARITIAGYPGGPVWTSPYTGRYRVRLPQGSYTVSVTADYPGYQHGQLHVEVGADSTRNITLTADKTTCTAPGYGPRGLAEDFAGWTGETPRDGWSATEPGWRFDNPGNRPPPPSGSVNVLPGTRFRVFAYFNPDDFAVADGGFYAPRALDTVLTSPLVSLSGQAAPQIAFDSAFYPAGGGEAASVQLSTDGGRDWSTVWRRASNALGPVTIPIPGAAGHASVRARFRFTGRGSGYWAVGQVLIGTPTCVPQRGGLVAGTITSQPSGQPVDGAQIASSASPQPQAWPAGFSLASADPALPAGFYWLFAPAGGQRVTATAQGYATSAARVFVAANRVTRHDWTLVPAKGG